MRGSYPGCVSWLLCVCCGLFIALFLEGPFWYFRSLLALFLAVSSIVFLGFRQFIEYFHLDDLPKLLLKTV